MEIELKRLYPGVKMPEYATDGSGAMDLRVHKIINETYRLDVDEFWLLPEEYCTVRTGLAVYIKDKRYAALLLSRSGLGTRHGITLRNNVGLIDSDYQGELLVVLENKSDRSFRINRGDRIAQLMIVPIAQAHWKEVAEFSSETERGMGGHGSTGVK